MESIQPYLDTFSERHAADDAYDAAWVETTPYAALTVGNFVAVEANSDRVIRLLLASSKGNERR